MGGRGNKNGQSIHSDKRIYRKCTGVRTPDDKTDFAFTFSRHSRPLALWSSLTSMTTAFGWLTKHHIFTFHISPDLAACTNVYVLFLRVDDGFPSDYFDGDVMGRRRWARADAIEKLVNPRNEPKSTATRRFSSDER